MDSLRTLGLAAILALVATPGSAQPVVNLGSNGCGVCPLEFERLLRLGDLEGPGMIVTRSSRVRMDSRGRFFTSDDVSSIIRVFSPDGQFVRVLGREGEGPGEFLRITAMGIGRADSIFAFDRRQGRVTVFGPDLELARTFGAPFPGGFDNAFVGAGWVVNANIRTPDRVGLPLHLVGWDGSLLASFGSRTGAYRTDVVYSDRRAVGPAGPNGVWAAWLNQYVVERWSSDGQLEMVITRTPSWFEPYWEFRGTSLELPPRPILAAVREQADTLWTLVIVPDPDWRDAVEETGILNAPYGYSNSNAYYDTIIEAIDLRSSRLVASQRVDPRLYGFAGPGLVYGPEWDAIGNPFVSIWKFSVPRSQGGRR